MENKNVLDELKEVLKDAGKTLDDIDVITYGMMLSSEGYIELEKDATYKIMETTPLKDLRVHLNFYGNNFIVNTLLFWKGSDPEFLLTDVTPPEISQKIVPTALNELT